MSLYVGLLWIPHVVAAGITALVWQMPGKADFWEKHKPWWIIGSGVITILASLFSLISAVALVWNTSPTGMVLQWWGISFFYIDALSNWFNLIVAGVGIMAAIHCIPYIDFREKQKGCQGGNVLLEHIKESGRFYTLFHIFLVSMLFVQMADNLIMLCVMMELTTLISAFLVCNEQKKDALEAAWKYMSLCSVAIIFAFLGTLLLIFAFEDPSSATLNFSELIKEETLPNSQFVKLAFLFALIGYGTKAGLAPLHSWLPDSHAAAPSPVSAMLSGVLLKSALFAILRFYSVALQFLPHDKIVVQRTLLVIGLLSLALAVPFILRKQDDFKRILAYHSLEHMGIIFFGIGLGSSPALSAALLHSFYHALNKALMFIIHGSIRMRCSEEIPNPEPDPKSEDLYPERRRYPEKYRPLLDINPSYGILLAAGGLALVGSPPFAVFTTEYTILRGAFSPEANLSHFTAIIAISLFVLSLLAIFGGLVSHLGRWIMGGEEKTSRLSPGDDPKTKGSQMGQGPTVIQGRVGRFLNGFVNWFPGVMLFLFVLLFGFGFPEKLHAVLRTAADAILKGKQ